MIGQNVQNPQNPNFDSAAAGLLVLSKNVRSLPAVAGHPCRPWL
jgi:hypothetical protein